MKTFNKLAGRFTLVRREQEKIIVRCIGSLVGERLTQDDVNYICGFYNIPHTEKWLQEAPQNNTYFNLIIYKEEREAGYENF